MGPSERHGDSVNESVRGLQANNVDPLRSSHHHRENSPALRAGFSREPRAPVRSGCRPQVQRNWRGNPAGTRGRRDPARPATATTPINVGAGCHVQRRSRRMHWRGGQVAPSETVVTLQPHRDLWRKTPNGQPCDGWRRGSSVSNLRRRGRAHIAACPSRHPTGSRRTKREPVSSDAASYKRCNTCLGNSRISPIGEGDASRRLGRFGRFLAVRTGRVVLEGRGH